MSALAVTIIGGYLGAGKTTLVNRMLRQAEGARIAVLVNEFGELPIDEDLIEAREDDLISIAGGCICCSFGSDLTAALLKIAALEPKPDHIVIESSGVALPGAIASTVDLSDGLRVGGIVVLADALNIRAQAQDEYIGDTIERQIADADIIVLTKTDLIDQAEADAVRSWLAQKRPETPVEGQAPNSVLLGAFGAGEACASGIHHDGAYESVVMKFDAPCDVAALSRRLTDPSLGVVRAKGYVSDVSGRVALLQLAGKRVEITFPDAPGDAGLVCIGPKIRFNADALQALAAGRATNRPSK